MTIETHFPSAMPQLVADRVRFTQIMLNLLSNAVKFTQEGGKVDIKVVVERGNNNIAFFTISVTDSGIGMTESEISRALQSFGQIDSGLNRKFEGTGLGLPLTRRLVELHNASFAIESKPEQGTSIIMEFISDPAMVR